MSSVLSVVVLLFGVLIFAATARAANLLQPVTPAPFTPALSAAPSNFVLALNFAPTGADFDDPVSLAVDAAGNVFVGNGDGNSVGELTEASSYDTGLNFSPSGAAIGVPISLALDAACGVFVANDNGEGDSSVSELIGLTTPVLTPVQDEELVHVSPPLQQHAPPLHQPEARG
jgi:hypothetical protein